MFLISFRTDLGSREQLFLSTGFPSFLLRLLPLSRLVPQARVIPAEWTPTLKSIWVLALGVRVL